MFGLDEITWKEFIQFLVFLLIAWYTLVFWVSWIKSREKQNSLFEEGHPTKMSVSEGIEPIHVVSSNFPSKLISTISENSIPLEVSIYEETGPDDGIHIDYLLNELTGKLEKLLPGIQYQ
ncbi:hypothetical protein [uncultured Draconibacterium sp.]|uniref:hypothetical protein n=1 Tax=uncultured Draconibacterium sp. TaxID=1573823 RepID=UPI0029C9AE5B|nr:hypothetical protein [uncultured Draconibacterium sp.]